MEMLLLKYFKKVADCQSMTRAASELRVAQPAISKMIKKLEDGLGCKVFDRQGRNVVLNDIGRILLKYANRVFDSVEGAREEINDFTQKSRKVVRVQVLAGSRLFADIASSFSKLYPDCQLQISQASRSEEDFDLRIFASSRLPRSENCRMILKEQIVLVVPLGHPLSGRARVRLAELQDEEFLGLEKGMGLRTMTDAYCLEEGFVPKVICDVDNPSFLRELLAVGMGVAFMPAVSWGRMDTERTRLLTVEEGRLVRHVNIAWRRGRYLPAMAYAFLSFVEDYYSRLQTG